MDTNQAATPVTISKSQQKKLAVAQFNIDREVRIKREAENAAKKEAAILEALNIAETEKTDEQKSAAEMQADMNEHIRLQSQELMRMRMNTFRRRKKRLTKHKPSRAARVSKRKAARKARAITRNA